MNDGSTESAASPHRISTCRSLPCRMSRVSIYLLRWGTNKLPMIAGHYHLRRFLARWKICFSAEPWLISCLRHRFSYSCWQQYPSCRGGADAGWLLLMFYHSISCRMEWFICTSCVNVMQFLPLLFFNNNSWLQDVLFMSLLFIIHFY